MDDVLSNFNIYICFIVSMLCKNVILFCRDGKIVLNAEIMAVACSEILIS